MGSLNKNVNDKSVNNNHKPWLDHRGRSLSDEALKQMSGSWCPDTWEAYLCSIEKGIVEEQLNPGHYDKMAEASEDSWVSISGTSADEELKKQVEALMSDLSDQQKRVIQMTFWEGRSERSVARTLGISRSSVFVLKKRALKHLAKKITKVSATFPLVRGKNNSPLKGAVDDNKVFTLDQREILKAG
jgi:RNA polymerase sigma factor (sigma-70 family)